MPAHAASFLLLGIDGGASKTVALLTDATGTLLGRALAPGTNLQTLGVDTTLATLDQLVRDLFAAAGLAPQPVAAACLGLAGSDREADRALLQEWSVRHAIARATLVVNDARLVIAAGTPADAGVAVISGTGSIAVGRAADGTTARAGGWGYLFGDEGSGYDLGVQALRAVACAADGRGPATLLVELVLEHWGLRRAHEVIPLVYGQPGAWKQVAGLAPLVVRAAQQGDGVASALLRQAGEQLASAAASVARQLALAAPLPLVLAGSVLLNAEQVRTALLAELASQGYAAEPVSQVAEPALGAVRLARELALRSAPTRSSPVLPRSHG